MSAQEARRTVLLASPAPAVDTKITTSALTNPGARPLSFDHSAEPKLPDAKTAAAKSARFHPICFMEVSLVGSKTTLVTPFLVDLRQSHKLPLPTRVPGSGICTAVGKRTLPMFHPRWDHVLKYNVL
jgi:hypothetical protein